VGPREWFKADKDDVVGLEYAAKESWTTSNEWADEYTIVYEGAKLIAEQYLCFGDSFDPKKCLRI